MEPPRNPLVSVMKIGKVNIPVAYVVNGIVAVMLFVLLLSNY